MKNRRQAKATRRLEYNYQWNRKKKLVWGYEIVTNKIWYNACQPNVLFNVVIAGNNANILILTRTDFRNFVSSLRSFIYFWLTAIIDNFTAQTGISWNTCKKKARNSKDGRNRREQKLLQAWQILCKRGLFLFLFYK